MGVSLLKEWKGKNGELCYPESVLVSHFLHELLARANRYSNAWIWLTKICFFVQCFRMTPTQRENTNQHRTNESKLYKMQVGTQSRTPNRGRSRRVDALCTVWHFGLWTVQNGPRTPGKLIDYTPDAGYVSWCFARVQGTVTARGNVNTHDPPNSSLFCQPSSITHHSRVLASTFDCSILTCPDLWKGSTIKQIWPKWMKIFKISRWVLSS